MPKQNGPTKGYDTCSTVKSKQKHFEIWKSVCLFSHTHFPANFTPWRCDSAASKLADWQHETPPEDQSKWRFRTRDDTVVALQFLKP